MVVAFLADKSQLDFLTERCILKRIAVNLFDQYIYRSEDKYCHEKEGQDNPHVYIGCEQVVPTKEIPLREKNM